jgi:hypothetical protein
VINSFVEVLRKKIREDMNNYTDDLANGACQTFDQYQKLCGVIQGLALAESHLLSLAKKVEESDD